MSQPDYPDFATPQAHATAIAATGVPLLTAPNTLINALLQTVAAAGGTLVKIANFTQVGYAIQVIVNFPAAATNPFCEVTFTWSDPVSATVYDEAHYFVPGAAGASGFTVLGNGPVRSSQLTVTVTNLDAAQAATVTLQVAQDSCIRTADRWYWRNASDNGLAVPTFTVAQLPDDEDVLGILHNLTIPASSSATFLFGMAPGRTVQLDGTVGTITPASLSFKVFAQPTSVYTTAGTLIDTTPAAATWSYQFLAPRAPMILTVTNSSAVVGNIFAMMTAAE